MWLNCADGATYEYIIYRFQQWDGEFTQEGGDSGREFNLINKVDKGYHEAGTTLKVRMMGHYTGSVDPTATAEWCDLTYDDQTVPPVKVPASRWPLFNSSTRGVIDVSQSLASYYGYFTLHLLNCFHTLTYNITLVF